VLAFVGALVLGAAIFYITFTTVKAAAETDAKVRLGLGDDLPSGNFTPPVYIKLTKPLLKDGTLTLATGFFNPETIEYFGKQLRSAGLHRNITAEEYAASRFWFAFIVGIFLLLFFLFSAERPSVMIPIAGPLAAYFLPAMDIKSKIDERAQGIRLGMPYVLDLMTLSMEAGLDFQGAISKVIERAPNSPFIEELRELLKDIQLGKSRSEALRKMSVALDIPEITSLVAVLISTDQVGSPVGPVLRAQSETLRVERIVKAEKLGAQASQKILFPLVFFILPAVFLIIFGPIVLQMLGIK
jgi:tight adherence protein C